MHHCHENISDIEGVYALDKNTSARVCAKNAGGLMCEEGDTTVTQICGGNSISISDLA